MRRGPNYGQSVDIYVYIAIREYHLRNLCSPSETLMRIAIAQLIANRIDNTRFCQRLVEISLRDQDSLCANIMSYHCTVN